jgi:HTH-type transcriptional regulator / antitoxin HipB
MNEPPAIVTSMRDIGAVIRARRRAQGLTQKDLADVSGSGFRFISELERGKDSAEAGKVLRVLKELGLRVSIE